MPSVSKRIAVSFTLAAFLMLVFFGFANMMHGSDGRMPGDCPFSAMGASLCPQDTLAVALHHIAAYQSFFSVPIHSGITALIIFLLLALSAVFILSISPPLFIPAARVSRAYNFPLSVSPDRKIARWLSLLENSPSQ